MRARLFNVLVGSKPMLLTNFQVNEGHQTRRAITFGPKPARQSASMLDASQQFVAGME